jgi:DNA recombination-dependent growth factor C
MARIITNRAELKRRRDLMDAAIERARANRLAAEATRLAAAEKLKTAEAAARCRKAQTCADVTVEFDRSRDGAVARPPAPEKKVAAWIRKHGDAHKMTVVSNDEVNAGRQRVWTIRCGACDTVLRAVDVRNLQTHAASVAHAGALDAARAPESNVAAWIREHGGAHQMTVVSDDDVDSSGNRVWTIRCAACDKALRATGAYTLQRHAASAAHVAAVASGNAPESAIAAWIREHGDAHKMTVVSNDEVSCNGARVWTIRCAACDIVIRATRVNNLQRHVASAAHAGALDTARAPESKVSAWMREHGDANKMTVVSNDEIDAHSHRVWTVRCGACDTVLRVSTVFNLQTHDARAAHAGALDPAHAPESKVAAWLREHGDANKMTVVSNDEIDAGSHRVWIVRCAACDTVHRATRVDNLQRHVTSAAHARALDPARAPVSKRPRS